MMTKEWQIVDARRDNSHEFRGSDFFCESCRKPRWQHARDGFTPSTSPSRLPTDPQSSYRGHPYWARPGTLRISPEEAEALDREIRLHQQRIAAGKARKTSVQQP